MRVLVWPQAARGEIRLWIGAIGYLTTPPLPPPAPRIVLNGNVVALPQGTQWLPIRDREQPQDGMPRTPGENWCMQVRLPDPSPGARHEVRVECNEVTETLRVRSIGASVPAAGQGSFNVLLSSCYYGPNDNGVLARIVRELPQHVDLTLLAGDQIYGDLPVLEDLPSDDAGLRRALNEKYLHNWLGEPGGDTGLRTLLQKAPTICIPDDHEYWNNFPFPQVQLPNTWKTASRARWQRASRDLFVDWQQGGASSGPVTAQRLDIEPLRFLFLDTRSLRGTEFDSNAGLFDAGASAAIAGWANALLADRSASRPAVGVLATGQALFVKPPSGLAAVSKDAELANYTQAREIEGTLDGLATAGVPVVFLTGDVHWGRVVHARHRSGRAPLWEVICSPSRLLSMFGPGGGIPSAANPWPDHSRPERPPHRWGAAGQFTPEFIHGQRGDQVAVLSFARAGSGVELAITYWPIHAAATVATPVRLASIRLRTA